MWPCRCCLGLRLVHTCSLPHAHIRTRFKWLNIITLTLTLPGASFGSHFGLFAPAHITTCFKWLNMITLTLTRTLQHVLNGFVVGVIVPTLPLHQNLWMFVSEKHTDVFNLSTWFIGCIHSFTFIDSHLLNTQYSASLTTPDIFAHNTVLIFSHHTTHFYIVQELCESRGGRPGLSVLTNLLVSVDVKNY